MVKRSTRFFTPECGIRDGECAPALLTVAALATGGWALEQIAPGARSIGKAMQQLTEDTGLK